jgi:bacteriocin biosynthesis cyclodehydratase domain-containing protein
VSDEDQEATQAPGAGCGRRQGRLNADGDRASGSEVRSPTPSVYRLKRSLEVFPASDGNLYLVRLGLGDDLVISEPTEGQRALVSMLSGEEFVNLDQAKRVFTAHDEDRSLASACIADLRGADVLEMTPYPSALDATTATRYDRQLIYFSELAEPEVGPEPIQTKLGQASVLLLGCGGLGSWVAAGLTCAGVGELVLVDNDRVELSNLNRQVLFSEAQIGRLKVDALAEVLAERNSAVNFAPVVARIDSLAAAHRLVSRQPDLVITTADWPPHQLLRWINTACVERSIPWIGAGQFPPRLRIGPFVIPGRSACYECLESATRANYPLYEELTNWRAERETTDSSVGPISGVIGSLLATEALHYLSGATDPACLDRAAILDLSTMEMHHESIARDSNCAVCAGAG